MRYNRINDYVVDWGPGHYLTPYAYQTKWLAGPKTDLSKISDMVTKREAIPVPYNVLPRHLRNGIPQIVIKHGPPYITFLGFKEHNVPPNLHPNIELILNGTKFVFTMTIHQPTNPFDYQAQEKLIREGTSSSIKIRSDIYRKQRNTPIEFICSGFIVTGNQTSRFHAEEALSKLYPIKLATFDSAGSFLSLPAEPLINAG